MTANRYYTYLYTSFVSEGGEGLQGAWAARATVKRQDEVVEVVTGTYALPLCRTENRKNYV